MLAGRERRGRQGHLRRSPVLWGGGGGALRAANYPFLWNMVTAASISDSENQDTPLQGAQGCPTPPLETQSFVLGQRSCLLASANRIDRLTAEMTATISENAVLRGDWSRQDDPNPVSHITYP